MLHHCPIGYTKHFINFGDSQRALHEIQQPVPKIRKFAGPLFGEIHGIVLYASYKIIYLVSFNNHHSWAIMDRVCNFQLIH